MNTQGIQIMMSFANMFSLVALLLIKLFSFKKAGGLRMANQEHLNLLQQGVEVWNQWRQEQPDVVPDLHGADLSHADLRRADLSGANLSEASLVRTNLYAANLSKASLVRARLSRVNLPQAILSEADLSYAKLYGANLISADLSRAKLSNAHLNGAYLSGASVTAEQLGEARSLKDTIMPDGSKHS
jgi:uncharacterized protein YjbI with pentapeptide repeats